MGQQETKVYTRGDFLKFYSEEIIDNYYPCNRSFGYKKDIINQFNVLLPINADTQHIEAIHEGEKGLKKKQFNSNTYPYSCIGLLQIHFKSRINYATGFLIGNNLVLTAAKNIYNKQEEVRAQKINFILNVKKNEGDIYQTKETIYFHDKFVYEAEGSHRYNYALLEVYKESSNTICEKGLLNLQSNPGLIYGYLGIHSHFKGLQNIYIFGYNIELVNEHTHFALRGEKIDKLLCKNGSIGYKMESCHSQTGSPILIRRGPYYHVVGLHVSGKKDLSSGLQFDEQMRKTINGWLKQIQGELNLSKQRIELKGMKLLTNLSWHNMMILRLDQCHLTSSGLKELTKIDWPSLRELDVSENGIDELLLDSKSIKNLLNLNLSKNNIKNIEVISELWLLHYLDLSVNKIENIVQIMNLKYLQRLQLSTNRILKIPSEISNLLSMKKLYLSRNLLQELPVELLRLKQLIVLALDNNNIKDIPANPIINKLMEENRQIILK